MRKFRNGSTYLFAALLAVFTIGCGQEVVNAPSVIPATPAAGATGVPLTTTITANFSMAMNPATITAPGAFTVTGPDGPIAGTVTYSGTLVTFTPTVDLAYGTLLYTATITTAAKSLQGIPLVAPAVWTFTTGITASTPPPVTLGSTISQFGAFGGNGGLTNEGIYTTVQDFIGTTGASSTITGFHDDSVLSTPGEVPQCSYTESGGSPGTALVGTYAGTGAGTGTIAIFTAPPTLTTVTTGFGCPLEAIDSPTETIAPGLSPANTQAFATEALAEAQTAYTALKNLPPGTTLPSNELGNLTLYPGTYTSATFYDITAGPLTLDAQGDANAVWVFQMGSYLTVGGAGAGSSESVILTNGASYANVFWQVGSAATINYGGGGTMQGNILAQAAITLSSPGQNTQTSANTALIGRALSLTSVTMVNTVITEP